MRSFNEGSGRRTVGLLGAIFSYAITRKLRETNPVHGLDKPADVRRMRRLAESEYAQLRSALQIEKNVANDVFLFLAISGWRSGEAKNLKFSEVDLERRVATLGNTKTGLDLFKDPVERYVSGGSTGILDPDKPRAPTHNFLKSQTAPELIALQHQAAYQDSAEYKIIEAYKSAGLPLPDMKKILRR